MQQTIIKRNMLLTLTHLSLTLFMFLACDSISLVSNPNPTEVAVQTTAISIIPPTSVGVSDKSIKPSASSLTLVSTPKPTSTLTPPPTVSLSPTPTPFGGGTGKIAFRTGSMANGSNIYLMNIDGTELIQLTNNTEIKCCPAWSPDGQKLVFKADRDISIINADGSSLTKLVDLTPTDGEGDWYDFPVWSPDSQQILFASHYLKPSLNLVAVNSKSLTGLQNAPVFPEMGHTWSPDGQYITFASNHNDLSEIYVINSHDQNLIQLTNNTASDWEPVWSPDGQSIAFVSDRDGDVAEIYLMNADGSDQRRLTETWGRYVDELTWSPDGRRIAYSAQYFDDDEWNYWISIINTDGSNQKKLAQGSDPVWSPDGRHLAFTDEQPNIFIIDDDGSHVIRLSTPPLFTVTTSPVWQPSLQP